MARRLLMTHAMRWIVMLSLGGAVGCMAACSSASDSATTHDVAGEASVDGTSPEASADVSVPSEADDETGADGTLPEASADVSVPSEAGAETGADASATCDAGPHGADGGCLGWSPNVRVSRPGELAFEPAVAADSKGHLYAPYMNLKSTGSSVVLAVSSDGGAHFAYPFTHEASGGPPPGLAFSGDVAAAASESGDAYFVWIDYFAAMGTTLTTSQVMLTASHDAGITWSSPVVVSAPSGPTHVADRPWVAVGADGTVDVLFSRGPDFTNFAMWEAALVRSTDHGATFSVPVVLSSTTIPVGTQVLASFGLSEIGSDTVIPYAAIDTSTNSTGAHQVGVFDMSHGGTAYTENGDHALVPGELNKGFPSVGGTPSSACFAFVQADDTLHNHAEFAPSTDGAKTFSLATPLHADPADDDRTVVAADTSGKCFVFWINFANEGGGELWSAVVGPDGKTLPPQRVNDHPLNLGNDQTSQGEDYLSAAAANGRGYVIWVDRRVMPQAVYLSWSGP